MAVLTRGFSPILPAGARRCRDSRTRKAVPWDARQVFGAISIQPSGLSPFREEARRPRRPATKRRLSAPRFLTAQRPVTLTGAGRFHSRPEAGWPPVRGHRGGWGLSLNCWARPGRPLQSARPGSCHPTTVPPTPGSGGGGGSRPSRPAGRGLPPPRPNFSAQLSRFRLPGAGRRGAAPRGAGGCLGGRHRPDDAG